jgi:hypothetical protein
VKSCFHQRFAGAQFGNPCPVLSIAATFQVNESREVKPQDNNQEEIAGFSYVPSFLCEPLLRIDADQARL